MLRHCICTLGSNSSIFITFFGLCRTTKHSSVHILNQQTGKPAADVTVTLEKREEPDNGWLQLNTAKTGDKDGRVLKSATGPSKLRLLAITVSYLKPGTISET